MSLETRIEALTAAVVALTAQMSGANQMAAAAAPPAAPVAPPAPPAPPAMPAAPTFTPAPVAAPAPPAPPAAPAAPGLPFTDVAGLVKYATDSYQTLEAKQAGRGTWLQQVVNQMGVGAVNELRPDQYAAFHATVENLKVQP